jgi:The ARF-like 2 binding protein BART
MHARVVDQITAVDNFIAFKKLMIRRNTELNQEALSMMLKKEQQSIQL